MSIENDKAEYIVYFVDEFGKTYNLTAKESFNYLDRFKGIDFLDRQYNIAHTLPYSEMIENLSVFCRKNGGKL